MQIRLTEQQYRDIRAVADRRGVSIAAIIRDAIEQMPLHEDMPNKEAIRHRAALAVGYIHDTVSDVSRRHDDYLAEAHQE